MKATEIHGRELEKLSDANFAVLPLGSFEYHGPHSPLGTDIFLAEGFGNLVDSDLNGVIFPTIPYTACPGKTSKYKGTVPVRPSIIQEYITDVVEGILNQGINRIILLNAHDGNMGVSRVVAEYVTQKFENASFLLINWWQMVEIDKADELGLVNTKGRGHGGPYEMSATKAFKPNLIHVEKDDSEFPDVEKYSSLPYILVEGTPKSWDGYTGLIQQTSLEMGNKIVGEAVENMNRLIKNWIND
ncbi:creatininase family protein [Salinibacillus aidingensis]|uniref:Creatininase family protein n=1 Tax=Salinibacillus aidingensis TaxID=237684 RepID=A0ABN1AXR9_9BACI